MSTSTFVCQAGLAVRCGAPVVDEASVPAFEDEVGVSLRKIRRKKNNSFVIGRGNLGFPSPADGRARF